MKTLNGEEKTQQNETIQSTTLRITHYSFP